MGAFATIRLAVSKVDPEHVVAVKTVVKEKFHCDFGLLKRELEILKSLDHPNAIKFYETYQDEKYFHFVMEYCSGGNILERFIKKK